MKPFLSILLGHWSMLVPALMMTASAAADSAPSLEAGFREPPPASRVRAYWWWLNGNVDKAAITRDLEEMAAKGWGGALICDAGGAQQTPDDGNSPVPHGPTFFTPPWRELYKHALREADRLGLIMSLNIQSGWNLGGPMIQAKDAPKRLVWSETRLTGPARPAKPLEEPKRHPEFYRDVAVLAYPIRPGRPAREPLKNWRLKIMEASLGRSSPPTTPLFEELPARPGGEDLKTADVLDLTAHLRPDGTLDWQAPAGEWEILRIGCTVNEHPRVMFNSEGWDGYALDTFDADILRSYWQQVVEPLIADAGPLAGRTLQYLHTDSWEIEMANWTPTFREEFRRRRGYDLLAYLPVIAGRIVESRDVSNRFLHDFRKTMGDLAVDNHFRVFAALAEQHGLQIHPESGGPHALPIDSLRCLGVNHAPMSEFWARSWKHRVADTDRFFVKQPASAAHTCGRKLVVAEGLTTVGPHWQETLWDNLKPTFDQACCEGFNMLMWHAFTCSPASMGVPGQQYFAGTHMDPQVTWWSRSGPFIAYLNRLQFMLQQGLFVADVVYYYGDHVPNYAQLKASDPARILPGYDYDVATEEVVLTRMSVQDGRIVLPDGMSYRVLVLANYPSISLPVLRKVKELVSAGATVIGQPPKAAASLQDYPECDREFAALVRELWGSREPGQMGENRVGTGRVIWGRTARDVLKADGIDADFDFEAVQLPAGSKAATQPAPTLDYIHRRDGQIDIYFVANRTELAITTNASFRVTGKHPELWDPLTGRIRRLNSFVPGDRFTRIPLEFTPYLSWFVVFRAPAADPIPGQPNFTSYQMASPLTGPWTVHFDPQWGGPESADFPELVSWTKRPEDGIRFYSGTATYRKTFDRPAGLKPDARVFLNLGHLRELAEVRLNGKNLGILWAPPFRVEITDALQPAGNRLEVDIVNFWPNRLIGDASLPPDQRRTKTNIGQLTKDRPLMESGLLGPVTLESARPQHP